MTAVIGPNDESTRLAVYHDAMSVDAEQTVFLHFPKTAGTALAQLLHAGDTRRLAVSHWPEAEQDLRPYDLVHGHLYYDQMHRLAPEARRITMLRHPIERLQSLYRFHLRRPDDPMHQIARSLSFHDFVDRGYGTQTYVSMLTDRMESGLPEPAPGGRSARLDLALERLGSFDAIGITEHFDYSLLLVCHALGRPPIWRRSRANAAPEPADRGDLEARTIALIRQRASLDIRIYEAARDLFRQRLETLVETGSTALPDS